MVSSSNKPSKEGTWAQKETLVEVALGPHTRIFWSSGTSQWQVSDCNTEFGIWEAL